MNWIVNLMKDIAQGAVIVTLVFLATMIGTMGILLIPYLIFVIFSFIFIRPFLSGKRKFTTCVVSLSKFFTICIMKFIFVAFAICLAGLVMRFGYLSMITEWDADMAASAFVIGALPFCVGAYLAYSTYCLVDKFFIGTWSDYLKSLTGRY